MSLLWAAAPVPADEPRPAIGIIIDDLGDHLAPGERATRLPGAVACAFLPHAPYTRTLALQAHSRNKEIILHLPMESVDRRRLGPGSLRLHMTHAEFARTLESALDSVPHVSGINNHMGSLLTRHPGHMLWLMRAIKRHDNLFFVDSRTTRESVARMVADEAGVPNLKRDVFLDTEREPRAIEAQFRRLLTLARRDGRALAIGHPYPETLAQLERLLPTLEAEGVDLLPVARLVEHRQRRKPLWQMSSFH